MDRAVHEPLLACLRALHRVRLPGAGLPVREDGHVRAAERRVHERGRDRVEDLGLRGRLEHAVEHELPALAVVREQLRGTGLKARTNS